MGFQARATLREEANPRLFTFRAESVGSRVKALHSATLHNGRSLNEKQFFCMILEGLWMIKAGVGWGVSVRDTVEGALSAKRGCGGREGERERERERKREREREI